MHHQGIEPGRSLEGEHVATTPMVPIESTK